MARSMRRRGLRWGVVRFFEELHRPTYEVSESAGWRVEQIRRLTRGDRWRGGPITESDSRTGADVVAVYEYSAGNLSFDFASFLVSAEAYALRHGKRTVFVAFVPRAEPRFPNHNLSAAYPVESQQWRLANILVPLVGLHPASIGYALLPTPAHVEPLLAGALVYPPRYSQSFATLGLTEPSLPSMGPTDFVGLQAPAEAARYVEDWAARIPISRPMVVITLRQRTYDPLRNSNAPEWIRFAGWLTEQGYAPVFVTDTDVAWPAIPGLERFTVMREAPWNLGLRMALYEAAYVNFFFSNGPGMIAWLNRDVRFIDFQPVNERSLHATTAAMEEFGLRIGQRRCDFAQPGQLLCWEADDFETIRDQFTSFVAADNARSDSAAVDGAEIDEPTLAGLAALDWACPTHATPLTVTSDWHCPHGCAFPISGSVSRFLGGDSYSTSFGMQWSKWPRTQLDSHTGASVSRDRLRATLGPDLFGRLAGMKVLEVGSGAGRFTEVLLSEGAFVCSVDMSIAIDTNAANCPASDRHVLAQADATQLPFTEGQFDIVLAMGVIQHTPKPEATIAHLSRHVRPGGWLVIDHYGTAIVHHVRLARAYRAVLRRMDSREALTATDRLYRKWRPVHLRARSYAARKALVLVSPIVYYYGDVWPELDAAQRDEWSALDTHDSLTDFYKNRRSIPALRSVFRQLQLRSVFVRRIGLVNVARGQRAPVEGSNPN